MTYFEVPTRTSEQVVNITGQVQQAVQKLGIVDGAVTVFVPHTTCGVTVNENADPRPVEGLASVGAGWVQRMWFAVVPQVAPNWLSYALLRLEINVRASAILGFVGAGGIGYDLKVAIGWGQGRYDAAAAIFVLLVLSIVVIDQSSERLRNRLIRGKA